MSFYIALSGLAATQKDLDVTANNIANVKTTGFKQSRAEFADVYASSVFSNKRTKVGDGVLTAAVAQQFTQGSLDFTENVLDMAIKGSGFFAVKSGVNTDDVSYTRAGAFKLNRNNYIVDNSGNYLQSFPVDARTGRTISMAPSTMNPLRIPDTAGEPRATENLHAIFNLDARVQSVSENMVEDPPGSGTMVPGGTSNFDPTKPSTYNTATSTTIYDSLGAPHVVNLYYVKRDENVWDMYATIDDDNQPLDLTPGSVPGPPIVSGTAGATAAVNAPSGNPATSIRLEFSQDGTPFAPIDASGNFIPANFSLANALTNGADDSQEVTLNFNSEDVNNESKPSQFASSFEVSHLVDDGSTVGRLTSVDVDASGLVAAQYSNGDTRFMGRVALLNFSNEQGLQQIGSTMWRETIESGTPLAGEANTGTFGAIESSALESSNVNLTQELVDMIVAQKNFQANSRALEVNSQLQQTILQVR